VPSVARVEPAGARCCDAANVCPHCWGRKAAAAWAAADAALFGTGTPDAVSSRGDLVMLTRRAQLFVTYQAGREATGLRWFLAGLSARGASEKFHGWRGRTDENRLLLRRGALGGFDAVHIGHEAVPPWRWHLTRHHVVFAPPAQAAEVEAATGLLFALKDAPRISLASPVTRAHVARAYAAACRYPTYFFTAAPAVAIAGWEACRGRKLWASFGALRTGRGTKG
jgi:hypothetical protein